MHATACQLRANQRMDEIEHMKQGTHCNKVLKKLVCFFARFGLPDVLVSDNGPPFNSHNFVNFLERQGIRVMKSPPYNPASNGQAERLVRTVKEVLKCFLLEPEVAILDLEDQINLFLFNFRNNNLSKDGRFPSEKIFCYKPKTVLDLINPKKHYKNNISEPQSDEETTTKNQCGRIPRRPNDAIDELMTGDEVWYKNHNPQIHARWIKATFIKKYSHNTFQIRIGSANVMAHRTQIKICKDTSWQRPNVLINLGGAESVSNEEQGASTVQQNESRDKPKELPRGSKKRKHPVSEDEATEPRRSKRERKTNKSDDYFYS